MSDNFEDIEKKDAVPEPVVLPVGEDGGIVNGDEALKVAGEIRHDFTQAEQDAVKRKIDRRVVPLLAAVYFSQFLDKTSLNYSAVMGLPIKGNNYSLVALAFYLGFLVFELPTSALAIRFPLAKYLGVNVILWAVVLTLQAASPLFAPFFVLRFLLGVFECCVTPILLIMIAAFYQKGEQAKRIACFYVSNGLTSIFGGVLAWGITFYHGTEIAHWRIIFIILGGLALCVGISVFLWLPDSPATATFLTPRERLIAIERIRENQSGTVNKQFKRKQAIEALTDVKTWLMCLLVCAFSVPNGGLSNFQSILITSFGYTSSQALLLNAPGGAVAAFTTLVVCYWSDKNLLIRSLPFVTLTATVCGRSTIIGCAILVGVSSKVGQNRGVSLFGIYLTQTFGSGMAVMYSWLASNVGGSTKKAVTNALIMASFALGNIIGTEIFQAKDAPQYLPGKIAILALFVALIPISLVLRGINMRSNRQKKETLAALTAENGWSAEDLVREADRHAFMDLTDRENPYFVYLP